MLEWPSESPMLEYNKTRNLYYWTLVHSSLLVSGPKMYRIGPYIRIFYVLITQYSGQKVHKKMRI
jgi:hypothetical protein